MSNILIQYDWNNHKEMSQKKLAEEFIKLSLSDKIKIYRILSDRRKLILRKGYDKSKQEKNRLRIKNNKKYVIQPLSDLIDGDELKTDNEIYLTLGILLSGGGIGYYDNKSPNYHKEEESFQKAKNKIIGFFETMYIRKNQTFPHEDDGFYTKLKELEYIPSTTITEVLKWKKEKWLQCYIHIGVGKDRAERLSTALIKRLKIINEYDAEIMMETNKLYFEWKNKILQSTQDYAIRYYTITQYECEQKDIT